jgi:hypothetical protein
VPSAFAGAGTLDATETTFAETDTLTGDGLLSTTPLQLVSSTMAAVAEADATITFTVEDSNGTVIPAGTVYTATATGSVVIAAAVANVSSKTGYVGASGAVVIDVAASSSTATGTGTLVLTIGGGSKTVYYRAVGAVASITLANEDAFTHLAAGAAGTANALTYAEVDASGFALPATASATDATTLSTLVTYSKDGATAGSLGIVAATTAGTYVNSSTTAGKLTIASGSCAAGDAGKTRTIAIKIGTITSNTLSFVCTKAGTTAKITAAALAAETVSPGQALKINFTVVDEGGLKMGFGATIDFEGTGHVASRTLVPGALAVGAMPTLTVADATVNADGKFSQTITASNMPGSYGVIIAITDADLNTTGNQAAEYSLAYTVTNVAAAGGADATLAAGPKKLKATATFGASAANKKVAFTLENANGVVKTYYRKANASGVATFTLRFKGTFEVTASYGDAITDTVTLKK